MIYSTSSKQENIYSTKSILTLTISISMVLNAAQAGSNAYSLPSLKSDYIIAESDISSPESAYTSRIYIDGVYGDVDAVGKLKSYRTIDEIQQLSDNWNDNGAPAFSESHIIAARKIVDTLNIQPEIFPTANGSIQFEYENEKDDYLEFELFKDGRLKMFFYASDGSSRLEYISTDSLAKVVEDFYGNKL